MRLALALVLTLAAAPAFADTGEQLFNSKCGDCHSVEAGSPPTGPSLKGVVGRKLAGAPDFDYSAAMKAKGGAWTEAALDAFLANPQAAIPGTAMFGGAPDPGDRKAIIDYLKTVK